VWAVAGAEVWQSWLAHDLPFHQIHGHTVPYFWGGRRWNDEVDEHVQAMGTLHPDRRQAWWQHPNGPRIVGIDPGLGRRPSVDHLKPVVLVAARLMTGDQG
jgi:hypothetical protein